MQQLTAITFDDLPRAEDCLGAVTRLVTEGSLTLRDAVFVTKHDDGSVHVHETADRTAGEGAVTGAFWGLLVGTLLLGPVGGIAVGAASTATGALLGKLIDSGVDNAVIDQMKAALAPGRTALILLLDDADLDALEGALTAFAGAELLWSDLPGDAQAAIEQALEQGVAHDGVDVTRTSAHAGDEPAAT